MEIITGYVGKPHVTSEQDRDVHIGMIGSGSYVLQTGKRMTAEISSNNEIKVRDGVLMHQGCAASIKKNTYDSLSIVNGSQGMKRIDLIVARYERNRNTGVESLTLKVLKGTPASANPATPAYTTGDIQAGDYIADMPMYKVTLDGINITKLEKQFQTVETNATLTQKVNVLNSTLKWSDWISLGQNALGVWLLYRYNAYEVELSYRGNLKAGMSIGGGSVGYQWPGFPTDLKPPYNFEAPIYSVVGDNPKLSLRFFPDNGTITITSHATSKTSEEYISGFYRYTRR